MLAIIKTGGKQYLVSKGQKIKIEKINEEEGKEVVFDQVLLFHNGGKTEIGTPFLKDKKVIGKVLKHEKLSKVEIFKYKPKKRYKLKKGHRQPYTEVEIIKIKEPYKKTGSKKGGRKDEQGFK